MNKKPKPKQKYKTITIQVTPDFHAAFRKALDYFCLESSDFFRSSALKLINKARLRKYKMSECEDWINHHTND